MHKYCLFIFVSLFALTGCVSNLLTSRQDVAVSFDSERIAYSVIGEGETVIVFIHGWSCDGRYWREQVPALAGEYRLIIVDLAGHGHSSLARSNLSMSSFARDVKAVLDKENVDSAILIGHSMGGAVIAETARLLPHRVAGIIGIDTLQNVGERISQSEVDAMVESFEDGFRGATEDFVASMFPQGASQGLMNWVAKDMSSAPKEVALSAFSNYLGQYVTGEAAAVFEGIAVPVVSINARLWPTAPEENMKHIRNYQLLLIEEVGHFPMLERPDEFNRLLKEAIVSIHSKPVITYNK